MKIDVTFLVYYDGLDSAFGFVNGVVIVDSLALVNRLMAESAYSLVAFRRFLYR